MDAAKSFDILATSLNVLHNYFSIVQTKLFSNLAKFFRYFKFFPGITSDLTLSRISSR